MMNLNTAGALLQATENTLFYAVPTTAPTESYLIWSDFWLQNIQSLPVEIFEISKSELQKNLKPLNHLELEWQEPSKHSFAEDFSNIQKKIQNEGWHKVVPFVFETCKVPKGLLEHSLYHLTKASNGYAYAFWNTTTWFSGLSPETLYEWRSSEIKTLAVAGTNHSDRNIDLQQSQKDKIEHQYVIDGITEALQSFGEIRVGKTQVVNAGVLQHLKAEISCKSPSPPNAISLLHALHPTPAVGTYPLQYRRQAMQNLLQSRPPLIFACPFGLVTPKWHKVIVAIRNMQVLDNLAYLSAGCGIVKDSVLEEEWLELKAKRRAIKERLGLL